MTTEEFVRGRYDPYSTYRNAGEIKCSPRKIRRKQNLNTPKTFSKLLKDKYGNLPLDETGPTTIGNYVLTKKNMTTSLYCAVRKDNGCEYLCRVIEIEKYGDYIAPYCIIKHDKHINEIEEIILDRQYAYIFFGSCYGDLHTYIRSKRKLEENEACNFFKQIVSVVDMCHSNRIALRDLKLRKFVFKDKARTQLKLVSLDDCSVMTNDSDIRYDKHGCPAYVSPEILESKDGYSSKAADIWSLGVIIYTMLCGRYPFHEQDPISLFSKIKTGHFTINEPISSKAKCLIHSILRKNPSERLTSDELLEHPWFHTSFSLSTRTQRGRYDQIVPEFMP